ncbi:MAG: hypothetical protein GXP39_08090 [Chloroflexi bacterium]|nr:hypothetical protein [Chloroflexota bacterium]
MQAVGSLKRWFMPNIHASADEYKATYTASAQSVTIPMEIRSLEAAMEAFRAFVDMVRDIPSVEQVRAKFAGTYLHIVTYASGSTKEERRQIYRAELALADRYPDLHFEFDLIDRRGYPVIDKEETGKWIERIRSLPNTADAIQ